MIILAILNKFVYDYRGNNTYVIQEKKALCIKIAMLLQKFFHPNVCAAREGRVSEQPKMIMRQLLHIIILTNNFRLTYYCFFSPPFFLLSGRMSKPHPHCGQNVWRSPPIMRNPRLQAKVSPLRIQGRTNSSTQWGQKKSQKFQKCADYVVKKISERPFLFTFVI